MEEPRYGPTGAGTVLLELGAGVGALILHVPAELNGQEIEISRAGEPAARRTHAQVRERPRGGGAGRDGGGRAGGGGGGGGVMSYSALYPGLAAGSYTVWRDAVTAAATVTVTGGQIATCYWPATGPVPGQPGDS